MELSLKDRVILANQYRILSKLDSDDAEYYERLIKALEAGYKREYENLSSHFSEGLSQDRCQWVFDVLAMFFDMEYVYENLPDKTGINEHAVKYRGFDGNNETDYMGYANYLIEDKDQFDGLRPMNSHMPVLGTYNRMLDKYNELIRPDGHHNGRQLDKDVIIAITEAAIHPSQRT